MKKNPKVSIIIPVYNGKNYMKEAIDSGLAQTYQNIEIIVVNDGSTDNGVTRKIAESYGNKIKYFEKENGGVSTALNLAIEKMSGDYFSWLSHDDRYYKNKVESQVQYLQQYDDNTILYSDYDLMDQNSNVFAKSIKNHQELMEKPEYAILRGSINGITLLIPKKAFEDCGNFRTDLRCTQDYELWLKMMGKYKFIHQPEILATTRLHDNQTGNTSPYVLKENYDLWVEIIESFTDEAKIKLEGSIYNYYNQMCEFMKTTPYESVVTYLEKKLLQLHEKYKKIAKKTKVSVVIPYYNNVDQIERAVNSILNQTHKLFEIIIVDDGSKNKIKKKIINHKSVKLIELDKNYGVSHARNKGIKSASGDYIALLDADDEYVSNKIEKQLIFMLENNADFSYTAYTRKGEKETIIDCFETPDNLRRKCIFNCVIATPTIMVKNSKIKELKIKYNEQLKYGEDIVFYLELLKHVKGYYLNEPLTKVYVTENSAYKNLEKQITGTKNILKYLLNDEFYCNFNEEIAKLCYGFFSLINPDMDDNNKIREIEQVVLVQESRWQRYFNILKRKGPIYCMKRLCLKLRNKVKHFIEKE